MGQGLYTALVYGTMEIPQPEPDGWWEAIEMVCPKRSNRWPTIKASSEAKPRYIGFPLAVDDGCLQEWWEVGNLPYEAIHGTVAPRRVIRVTVSMRLLDDDFLAWIDQAKIDWNRVRKASKTAGYPLPPGQLLLVSDWD